MTSDQADGIVAVDIDNKVAHVQLLGEGDDNRLTDGLLTSLATVLGELEEDDDVWLVTLRGAKGRLGRDPEPLVPDPPPVPVSSGGRLARAMLRSRTTSAGTDVFAALRRFPKPIVALLEGLTSGRALGIALCCDLRVASSGATMSCPEVLHGAIPTYAVTQLLPRLIGVSYANDLLLTGRALSAAEAVSIGLVSRVAESGELEATLADLVAALRAAAPLATRFAKEAVVAGAELPLEAGITLELDLSLILQLSHDRAEGLRAFHGRRPPHYEGR